MLVIKTPKLPHNKQLGYIPKRLPLSEPQSQLVICPKDWDCAGSVETQVRIYQTTRCHITQDCMPERPQIAISPRPCSKIQVKGFQEDSSTVRSWRQWQHATAQHKWHGVTSHSQQLFVSYKVPVLAAHFIQKAVLCAPLYCAVTVYRMKGTEIQGGLQAYILHTGPILSIHPPTNTPSYTPIYHLRGMSVHPSTYISTHPTTNTSTSSYHPPV
jgi:hypothetical protein